MVQEVEITISGEFSINLSESDIKHLVQEIINHSPLRRDIILKVINVKEEAAEEKSQERIKEFKKYELLGEEIFLSGDDNEENPIDLYCDSNESPTLFAVPRNPYKPVRKFRLTKPQSIIEVHHRWEILNYCLGTPTAEDEVSLKDIFMHAKYVEEIL